MPTVFSLKINGGYQKIVAHSGAIRMMHDSWSRVSLGLDQAINKVGKNVEKREK